jgi:hypothetical protein
MREFVVVGYGRVGMIANRPDSQHPTYCNVRSKNVQCVIVAVVVNHFGGKGIRYLDDVHDSDQLNAILWFSIVSSESPTKDIT